MCGPLAILASAGSTMIKMNAQQKAGEAEKKRFDRKARLCKFIGIIDLAFQWHK